MWDLHSSPPQGTAKLPGEGWTRCIGYCPANPGAPALGGEEGSQRFPAGLGCKYPLPCPAALLLPEEPWLAGELRAALGTGSVLCAEWHKAAGDVLSLTSSVSGGEHNTSHAARAEVTRGARRGTHHVLTFHKSQLIIDESQSDVHHRAELWELGRDGEEPAVRAGQGPTAHLGSTALALGTGAAGTWGVSPHPWPHGAAEAAPAPDPAPSTLPFAGEAGSGLGPRSPCGSAGAFGGRGKRFNEPIMVQSIVGNPQGHGQSCAGLADLAFGWREQLLPSRWRHSTCPPQSQTTGWAGGRSSPGTAATLQDTSDAAGSCLTAFQAGCISRLEDCFQLTRLGRSLFRSLANKLSTMGSRLWKNKGAP